MPDKLHNKVVAAATDDSGEASFVHPLDDFYAQAGLQLPPFNSIDGATMPEPYRTLLVHHNDMTPTLEKFHRASIHLHMLGRRQQRDEYYREVVLELDGSDQTVEFGAIKIHLARFTPEARHEILEEHRPLGHILEEFSIAHTGRPTAFLRLASDVFINDALKLSGAHVLYGRRNIIRNLEEQPLAEIVEILPPVK